MTTWHKTRPTNEEGLSVEELPPLYWPAGHVCGAFPWLLIDMGEPNTVWVVPFVGQ